MTWFGLIWFDLIWVYWFELSWVELTWWNWFDLIWVYFTLLWFSLIDMIVLIWFDMTLFYFSYLFWFVFCLFYLTWFGLVWFNMIWIFYFCLILFMHLHTFIIMIIILSLAFLFPIFFQPWYRPMSRRLHPRSQWEMLPLRPEQPWVLLALQQGDLLGAEGLWPSYHQWPGRTGLYCATDNCNWGFQELVVRYVRCRSRMGCTIQFLISLILELKSQDLSYS